MTSTVDPSPADTAGESSREAQESQPRNPRVSVCIPAYNYAHYLGDAIESVLQQNFDDWELVVCDNASSDNTTELVASYDDPRIIYHRYKITVPPSYSFNRCYEAASGEYVLTLCADDMLAPDTLELLVEASIGIRQRPWPWPTSGRPSTPTVSWSEIRAAIRTVPAWYADRKCCSRRAIRS